MPPAPLPSEDALRTRVARPAAARRRWGRIAAIVARCHRPAGRRALRHRGDRLSAGAAGAAARRRGDRRDRARFPNRRRACRSASCRRLPCAPKTSFSATSKAARGPRWRGSAAPHSSCRSRRLLQGKVRILRVDVEDADLLLETDAAGRGNWQFTPRVTAEPAARGRVGRRRHGAGVQTRPAGAREHAHRLPRPGASGGACDRHRVARPRRAGRAGRARGGDRRGRPTLEDRRPRRASRQPAGDNADWPIDLRLAGDGTAVAVKGTIGTGERAGDASVDLTARLASAAALTPYAAGAASLPMPLELSASVRRNGNELRADPLHLSLAGAPLDGRITLTTGAKAPRLDAELATREIDLAKLFPLRPVPRGARRRRPLRSSTARRFPSRRCRTSTCAWRSGSGASRCRDWRRSRP